MLELRALCQRFAAVRDQERVALATLVSVQGSSYRRPGARALLCDHDVTGLVSGGCLEADLRERTRELAPRQSKLVRYDLRANDEALFGLGLGCKGVLEFLVQQIDVSDPKHAMRPLLSHLSVNDSAPKQQPSRRVLALSLDGTHCGVWAAKLGPTHLTSSPNLNLDAALDAALDAVGTKDNDGQRSLMHHNPFLGRVFVQSLPTPIRLAIFGAGPDALPMLHAAKALGWEVRLFDRRPALLGLSSFGDADVRILLTEQSAQQVIAETFPSPSSLDAAIVMSHHFHFDQAVLRVLANGALSTPPRYIGLLGAAQRGRELLAELDLPNVCSPAGLDIGAQTPQSIALSVLAEAQMVLNRRHGQPLSQRRASIHSPLHPKQCATGET